MVAVTEMARDVHEKRTIAHEFKSLKKLIILIRFRFALCYSRDSIDISHDTGPNLRKVVWNISRYRYDTTGLHSSKKRAKYNTTWN